ncbi:hypothetical protein LUTEI9C_80202 [Luteimonas sp. 9C]|nr:hypothetical protein LUTEI9C_80202 [Luteimonas sp. 9C]
MTSCSRNSALIFSAGNAAVSAVWRPVTWLSMKSSVARSSRRSTNCDWPIFTVTGSRWMPWAANHSGGRSQAESTTIPMRMRPPLGAWPAPLCAEGSQVRRASRPLALYAIGAVARIPAPWGGDGQLRGTLRRWNIERLGIGGAGSRPGVRPDLEAPGVAGLRVPTPRRRRSRSPPCR